MSSTVPDVGDPDGDDDAAVSQATSAVILCVFSAVVLLAIWVVRTLVSGTFPPYDPVLKVEMFGGLTVSCLATAAGIVWFRRQMSIVLGITLPLLVMVGTAVSDLAGENPNAGAQMFFAPPVLFAAYHLRRRSSIICTTVGVLLLSVVAFSLEPLAVAVHDVLFGGSVLVVLSVIVLYLTGEQRKALRSVRREADFDSLTGLANRQAFMGALARHLNRREETVALILIDVDHFKSINDTYGHPVGDSVLEQVARSFMAHCPDGALLGRIGGDEFAVLLPGRTSQDALEVAETLRRNVFQTPVTVGAGEPIFVSLSIGVAHRTGMRLDVTRPLRPPQRPEWNVDQFYTVCDYALYEAKRDGRGCTRVAGAVTPRDRSNKPALSAGQGDLWIS